MANKTLKSDDLFNYANRFARRKEAAGLGSVYPTFRQASKRFGVPFDEIEAACDDFDSSKGYMKPAVGVQCNGAIGVHERRGQWLVEAYV